MRVTMNTMTHSIARTRIASAVALGALVLTGAAQANTELSGWALMSANTFAAGPTSGQFTTNNFPLANPLPVPAPYGQPVQGLSAVLHGPTVSSFYVMPDNGYGAKTDRKSVV